MKERVYLGDWFYNAGIVGFIKILTGNASLDKQSLVEVGQNYIEFERGVFRGYTEKFFNAAFEKYGRYSGRVETLKNILASDDNEADKIKSFANILQGFKLLKDKLEAETGKPVTAGTLKKTPEELPNLVKKAIEILEEQKEDFVESDTKIYLNRIYGQKSFLNRTITKELKKKFSKDFEEPLLQDSTKKDKHLLCMNCGDRKAKHGCSFDTGVSSFLGLNKSAVNLVWNFSSELPLCDICEIIYFSAFAGFTDTSQGKKISFLFVNRDSSIKELYNDNLLLQEQLKKDVTENFLVEFFTELLLREEKIKAEYSLMNISLIELDLSSEVLPQVYTLNITRGKAKFLKNEHHSLRRLAKLKYRINDEWYRILPEFIGLFIKDQLGHTYLYKLARTLLLSKREGSAYRMSANPWHLQNINILICKYLQTVRRFDMGVSTDELWFVYRQGEELAKKHLSEGAENKIPSIAYRLLNALRTDDRNTFMDTLMRTYMHLKMEVPSIFVKALDNRANFHPLGYSFVNGLLNKSFEGGNKNE
ncbi:MAG TPA: type I-B CRISPR-associated protein Cas8b1/Cst1 [Deltaproteobacteria bacterium]|nr:type I-B CRISPR-associated protein Cas8b1/Cst1 [Deltaproteobacteria bacterium]